MALVEFYSLSPQEGRSSEEQKNCLQSKSIKKKETECGKSRINWNEAKTNSYLPILKRDNPVPISLRP